MALDTLPPSYQPYQELRLCSNVFKNVTIPLAINGQPLVLIGQGSVPIVWLAAPSQPNARTWVYVVKQNKVINPGIDLAASSESRTVSVRVGSVEVLRVAVDDQAIAVVDVLNLRPLGLDVTGSLHALMLGKSMISANIVVGARVGINLSVPHVQLIET